MNRFTKYACLLTAAFGLAACSGGKVQGSYDIVPLPNEMNEQGGAPFVLTSSTTIGYAEGDTWPTTWPATSRTPRANCPR